MNLGGFAEDESVVDGDLEAFNYGVAENYYDVMLGEEWDLLEDIDFNCIESVSFWLGYCDELYQQNKEIMKCILDGTFITVKKRTFIDAIVSEKRVDLAESYIHLGSRDIRLYILFMFYYRDSYYSMDSPMNTLNYVYKGTILNAYCYKDRDDLIKFLSSIFTSLDRIYNQLDDDGEKIRFLNIVRDNISKIKYSSQYEKIKLGDVCSTGFARVLVKE